MSPVPPPLGRADLLRRRLLSWYDRHARDLPWRGCGDPYGIWVSEVMLQQTRVDTVRERWPRFLARFPDLEALAASSEQDLLKEWEGLGYYARARNLRRAAQVLCATGARSLPDTAQALGDLPGFGPYTAAAVASIAFEEPVAVVDGNVERVLARLLGETSDVRRAPGRQRIRAAADLLLARRRPGDFNQALMDLGATVCVPRRPRCDACPLAPQCVARKRDLTHLLPNKARRGPVPHHHIAAGIVWRQGRVLIARRPRDGMLGGLWEFPGGKQREGETLAEACEREVREETGLRVRAREHFLSLDHAYSHFKITLHLFHCQPEAGRPRPLGCEEPRFVALGELDAYPFPQANRRALKQLLSGGRWSPAAKAPAARA